MEDSAVIYIKLERSIEVTVPEVKLSDVASVECTDVQIKGEIKNLIIYRFREAEPKRVVISVLRIIQLLERNVRTSLGCGILVQSVGEKDVFVQWVKQKQKKSKLKLWRVVLVSSLTFCGTAFTIMAYHNDIEIHKIFEGTVRMVLPDRLEFGLLIVELAYSLGLGVGIILFFNHVGKWKLTNDPTPIEVALRKYELDVDTTLIENADREGEEEEAT